MKITLLKHLMPVLLAAFWSMPVIAEDDKAEVSNLQKVLGYVGGKIEKVTTKEGAQELLCAKASLFSGKFTLRSFGGKLCKSNHVGLLALAACKGYKDFDDSSCAKNIHDDLKSGSLAGNFGKIFVKDVKGAASITKKLVCMVAPVIPVVGQAVGVGCALISK